MLRPYGRHKLYFVVVGTGRCGTVSFANLLTKVGIPCSHERLFGPDGLAQVADVLEQGGQDSDVARDAGLRSPQFPVAEASYMAVPYLNFGILSDATIIHVVRNPIEVILSFHNKLQYWHRDALNKWETFILSHLPELKQHKTTLMKNCCYVVRWNQWIERQAEGRHYVRIRLEHDVEKLLSYLRIPRGLWPQLSRMNTHSEWKNRQQPLKKPATSQDILASGFGDQVKLMMEKYGYKV